MKDLGGGGLGVKICCGGRLKVKIPRGGEPGVKIRRGGGLGVKIPRGGRTWAENSLRGRTYVVSFCCSSLTRCNLWGSVSLKLSLSRRFERQNHKSRGIDPLRFGTFVASKDHREAVEFFDCATVFFVMFGVQLYLTYIFSGLRPCFDHNWSLQMRSGPPETRLVPPGDVRSSTDQDLSLNWSSPRYEAVSNSPTCWFPIGMHVVIVNWMLCAFFRADVG